MDSRAHNFFVLKCSQWSLKLEVSQVKIYHFHQVALLKFIYFAYYHPHLSSVFTVQGSSRLVSPIWDLEIARLISSRQFWMPKLVSFDQPKNEPIFSRNLARLGSFFKLFKAQTHIDPKIHPSLRNTDLDAHEFSLALVLKWKGLRRSLIQAEAKSSSS